jgi:hypothetical protein
MKTLNQAIEFVEKNKNKGCQCPCCGQYAKIYKYKLFATSAMALIVLYKLSKKSSEEYFHVSSFAEQIKFKKRSPHFAELRFWGLIESSKEKHIDKKHSGYWKITKKGIDFVQNKIKVDEYILIYNNQYLGFDGDKISIKHALSNKFSYEELMKK